MSKHARDGNEASERRQKWQRLNTLRRSVPHCTKSALHAILTDVAEHGVPQHHAPKQMRQAAETDLLQWNAYGPLFLSLPMQTMKGKAVTVEAVNFFSFLHAAYKAGGCFSVGRQRASQTTLFLQFSVEPFAIYRRMPSRQCFESQG